MNRLLFSTIAILMLCTNIFGQDNKGTIRGKITTSEKKQADNVSVTIQGTNTGTITDESGNYELKVPAGTYTLIISQVGAKQETITVAVQSGKVSAVPTITLNISNRDLQEVTIASGRINKFTRKSSPFVSKLPLTNLENPQVYTSISKELLKDQQINNLDDALKNAAGVTKSMEATSRAGSGGTYYVLRGFVTQAKLRNGVAGNITTVIDAANVEAVEVIKGPSATLFGNANTSYGGLINRVTKKPFKSFGGELSYYGGSYAANRFNVDVNTPLDTAKKILFRMNAAYNNQNTFQDNGFRKSLLIAPSLSYQVNDKLSFLFDAEFSHVQSAGSQYIYIYGKGAISTFGVNRADQVPVNYKSSFSSNDLVKTGRNANFFGQMNYDISKAWKSQTNLSVTTSYSGGAAPYFYLMPGAAVRAITDVTSAIRTDGKTYNDSMYLERMVWRPQGTDQNTEIQQNFTGDFHIGQMRNRLTVGLDYLHTNTNITFTRFSNNDFYNAAGATTAAKGAKYSDLFDFVSISNPGADYYRFNNDKVDSAFQNRPAAASLLTRANTYTYSTYAADVLNITRNLLILVSLRVDHFENKGILNNSTNVTSQGYHQTALSPKFGAVYQVIPEQVSLFANYQTGFTNKTGTDYEGKAYKPEHASQYEGGVKFDLLQGTLSGNVSYYNIKVSDIVRTYDPEPTLTIQNGTQESKGVEAEVVASPVAGLNIMAGYGYNKSRYVNTSADLNGLRPVYAGPEQTANLWASYRITRGTVKGLGFGAGGTYAGETFAVNTKARGQFILPSYTLLNAAVFYDHARFRIGLKGNNLTNKKYWVGNGTMNPQALSEFIGNITFRF